MVWYSNFGEQFLGRLDPKTGEVTEFTLPELKPGYPGRHARPRSRQEGNLWIGMMFQGAIAKFDPKTEQFQFYPIPKEHEQQRDPAQHAGPATISVDGKIWTNNAGNQDIYRIDLEIRQITRPSTPLKQIPAAASHSIYGINSDSKNNL